MFGCSTVICVTDTVIDRMDAVIDHMSSVIGCMSAVIGHVGTATVFMYNSYWIERKVNG